VGANDSSATGAGAVSQRWRLNSPQIKQKENARTRKKKACDCAQNRDAEAPDEQDE
jgi:hypothetical protein